MLEDPGKYGLEKGSKVSPEEVTLELEVEREAGVCLVNKGENKAKISDCLWDAEQPNSCCAGYSCCCPAI